MKEILFVVATLACFALKGANGACTGWSSSFSLTGSASGSGTLEYANAGAAGTNPASDDQECTWDITCPVGQFVFVGRVIFGLASGDTLQFFKEPSHENLDAYYEGGTWGWTTHHIGRRALYHTDKLQIEYNTTSSGTHNGFSLNYKCYTSKCPAELVSYKTFSSAVKSGFVFNDNQPCPGTECSWTHTCPNPTDVLRIGYKQDGSHYTRYNSVSFLVASTSTPSTNFNVPIAEYAVTHTGAETLAASTGGYTLTYATPTVVSTIDQGTAATGSFNLIFDSGGYQRVTGFCHPATVTTCYNAIRDDAILPDYGVIPEEGMAGCNYKITCPSTAIGLLFIATKLDTTGPGVPVSSVHTSTDGSFAITAASGGSFAQNWDGKEVHTYRGIASAGAYIDIGSSNSDVTYSCQHPACSISAQSGLDGRTRTLTSTTLRADTEIPQTDEVQFFHSDLDGASPTFKVTSSDAAQTCSFTVTCPSGYYVIFNTTGSVVGNDTIVATGGGNTYTLNGHSSAEHYASVITAANSLTWIQTSHSHDYGKGYTVRTGCTSFVAGTCPTKWETIHFSSLSTAPLNTNVTLDTFKPDDSPAGVSTNLVPVGYYCAFSISCPANSYIKLDLGSGFENVYGSSNPNPNQPTFKNINGETLSTDNSLRGFHYLGVQSATMFWNTSDWTAFEYNALTKRGFYMNASCDGDMGPVASRSRVIVSPTCAASAQSGLFGKNQDLTSTALRADTLIPQTDAVQSFYSDEDGIANTKTVLTSQTCSFSVSCPTGYSVMLNVSGRFVNEGTGLNKDHIVATGGDLKTYEFTGHASTSEEFTEQSNYPGGAALITTSNTLSWTQSAHPHGDGSGYNVQAGCLAPPRVTCPFNNASTYFGSLSTAAQGTEVILDTYVSNSSGPAVPIGYDCDFPISCPAGHGIEVRLGNGFYETGDHTYANKPIFKDSNSPPNNLTVNSRDPATQSLDVQTATLSWTPSQWNSVFKDQRGFWVSVSCGSGDGLTPPTPPSPGTPSTSGTPPTPGTPGAPGGGLMTKAEALAEQQRLQTIQTYFLSIFESGYQKHIDQSIKSAADWTAAGCGPNYTCTGPNMCCKGTTAPYEVVSKCEDADNTGQCFFGCDSTPKANQCTLDTFQDASVCGTDSAGQEIPAWPMTDLLSGCSTGPTHNIDGMYEQDGNRFPVSPGNFFADATNNTKAEDMDALGRKWMRVSMNFAVVTNAANVSSGNRATVTFDPTMGLFIVWRAKNNGHIVVNGGSSSHFLAIQAKNYATADNFEIKGGDVTLLGAISDGPLTSTTTGTVRMLNVVNTGNVDLSGSSNVFIANAVSSGNITAVSASTGTRVLYNVSATGGKIDSKSGKSALFYVHTSSAATIDIVEGTHSVSHSTNAGMLKVSTCTSLSLYDVSNTGTITINGCGTITGSMLSNGDGGSITVTSGDIDVTVDANTGTIVLESGVTGTIRIPAGTSITYPDTVTVTDPGVTVTSLGGYSGNNNNNNNSSSSSSTGVIFGSGASVLSGVSTAVMAAMVIVLLS